MRAILVPVKSLDKVKSRQARALSKGQRISLVWAMLRDVASQLNQLRKEAQIVLVTPDRGVAEFGIDSGWDVILESEGKSESVSVDRAAGLLEDRGITQVLRLPADIPMVRASDLRWLLQMEISGPVAIAVPSRDGHGTNALLRTPPTAFPSRFGKNSLTRHQSEARNRGVELRILESQHISLDLDTEPDLEAFLGEGDPALESYRLIASWKRT